MDSLSFLLGYGKLLENCESKFLAQSKQRKRDEFRVSVQIKKGRMFSLFSRPLYTRFSHVTISLMRNGGQDTRNETGEIDSGLNKEKNDREGISSRNEMSVVGIETFILRYTG